MSVNVVFLAPYFGANILRVLRGLTAIDDARVGIITSVPDEYVPDGFALAGHYRVDNPMDKGQIQVATRAFQKEWGRVDRLVGFLEQMQVPLADVREALGIDGMHGETARNFRDKNRMKRVLAAAKLPVARQALVTNAVTALRFIEEVGYPVILKPVDGVGSQNTFRISDEGELFSALNRLLPTAERPVQAEEFVHGEEHTLEAVVIGGDVVWRSSTYYLPGPLKVLENPWMQYSVLLPREQSAPHVSAFAPTNGRALQALGLVNGFSHMEWFITGDGSVRIGEVGARPAGVNIMMMNGFAHDVDVWEKWARLEVHREWEVPERRYACGCAFLRGSGPGRTVAEVTGVREVFADLEGTIAAHTLPTPGKPRSPHYEGDGWIVVQTDETQQAVDALRRVVTGIQIRYQ